MQGVIEKYDENINQTCRRLVIKIFVRAKENFHFNANSSIELFQLNESSLFGAYVCRARNTLGVNHAEFVLRGSRENADLSP